MKKIASSIIIVLLCTSMFSILAPQVCGSPSNELFSLLWTKNTAQSVCSVVMGDINNDGKNEVVYSDWTGTVYAVDSSGNLLWTYPTGWYGKIKIGDLQGDGKQEIVVASANRNIYCLDGATGNLLWSYATVELAGHGDLVLADVNGDGKLEVVTGEWDSNVYVSSPANVYVVDCNGNLVWKYTLAEDVIPTASDVDNDGKAEVVAYYGRPQLVSTGYLYMFTPTGQVKWSISVSGCAWIIPFFVDVNDDGIKEIVMCRNSDNAILVFRSSDGYLLRTISQSYGWLWDVVDLNHDGQFEFVTVSRNIAYALDSNGNMIWQASVSGDVYALVCADLNGDGLKEVVVGSAGTLSVLSSQGSTMWSTTIQHNVGNIIIADITGDGLPDIIAGTCLPWPDQTQPEIVSTYKNMEQPSSSRFNPLIHGFGFDNYGVKAECVLPTVRVMFDAIYERLSSDDAMRVPLAMLLALFACLEFWHIQGHCYGISEASIYYYYFPEKLPSPYTCAHAIDDPLDSRLVFETIEMYHNEQLFEMVPSLFYYAYIVETKDCLELQKRAIAFIEGALDQAKPVNVNMHIKNGGWHSVVAYDYSIVGTDTYIKFYDSNNETHGFKNHDRTMIFRQDANGKYTIHDDGDQIWDYDIISVPILDSANMGTVILPAIHNHVDKLVDWFRQHVSELWDQLKQLASDLPEYFEQFVKWLSENMPDLFPKLLHFKLYSHAQFHVYNSAGMHVGFTTSGELEQQFDAIFLETDEMQYCALPYPEAGAYNVRLIGTSTGSYELNIEYFIQGLKVKEEVIAGETTKDAVHNYRLWLSPTEELILDNTPPVTQLGIGKPKYTQGSINFVTKETPLTLESEDETGGSGVSSTAYRIFNNTYDTGWIAYSSPFNLSSLKDGTYTIAFNSTDNAGNVEPTNTIQVMLFSWTYIFTDSYGRGTTLKINTQYKLFQFIAPNKDFGVKHDTKMIQLKQAIIICFEDKEMRLIATVIDDKTDFCSAIAYDKQTRKMYLLIDKPNC